MVRRLALTAAVLVLAGACHGTSRAASTTSIAPTTAGTATTTTATTTPATKTAPDTGCAGTVANASGHATIPWAELHNPILTYPDAGTKDVGVRLTDGAWHFMFSSVTHVGATNAVHWNIGSTTSADLHTWSPRVVWPEQADTEGLASPDIVQEPNGMFVVTYQSDPGDVGGSAKLYYRTSRDLRTWSAAKPLARTLHPNPGDRMIDGALAYVGGGVILGFKYGLANSTQKQAFEIAYSPSGSLAGPWTLVGRPAISQFGDTFENYEFFTIDGHWHLIATTNTLDRPYFATLGGPPGNPRSWLRWVGGRVLDIPAEAWNSAPGLSSVTHEVANAIYLCDARALDGHYYVFYAGSNELTAFDGWGHAKIGVARSTDLVHWQVP